MKERHKFGSPFYNQTFKKILKRELLSFFGRLLKKKKYSINKDFINLGSGNDDEYDNDNVLNCDFFNIEFFNIFKKKKIFFIDLRYDLPFHDNSFTGVFSEHTIEHLYPSEACNLIKEVFRILKKDGIFRIVVPDLKKYIDYYIDNENNSLDKNFSSGCEAIWNISQNFEHKSLWDAEWLKINLEKSGFSNCKIQSFKKGDIEELLLDKESRKNESLYIEARK